MKYWREFFTRLLVGLLLLALSWLSAALIILVAVPGIWAVLELRDLWRWWAHVWGILGY